MSYFRPNIDAMAGYQPGEQPRADGILKLNTNENPYPPSPAVLQAVAGAAADSLRKYPDPLANAFREKAAEILGVQPDWILAGNGSDDLLTIVTRCFAAPGRPIVAPTPSYILYRTLAEIEGAKFHEVPFSATWGLDDGFARVEPCLAFLPNPNSPSGTTLPNSRIRELASQLRDRSPLVIDEAYADFAAGNCIELVRELNNVIVTRSLSKSYALAGIRFGFAVARPEIIAGMIKVKDSYNCDAISIAAATAALGDQAYLRQIVSRIQATRTRLAAEMRRLGFTVPESEANFVWCTNGPAPARQIYEQLKQRRILVRFMSYPPFGDGLRITVGSDPEIDRLLDVLRTLV